MSARARAFTHHERSGHATLLVAAMLVLAVEALAMHFLLLRWNAIAAWVFTASTLSTMAWLVADYRATVARPSYVEDGRLVLRAGLRATVEAPLAAVAGVTREQPFPQRECLSLGFLSAPTHWVTFSAPVEVPGPFGMRRFVRAVGLEPDDPGALERALSGAP